MTRAFLAVLGLSLSACVSHYAEGPVLGRVQPPEGYGVIQVIRPPKQWGAMQTIYATVDDERWFPLYSGSCGAFYVKPGRVRLAASIEAWGEVVVGSGLGVTMVSASSQAEKKASEAVVDVPAGGAAYVAVEFDDWKEPPLATVLSEADGLDAMAGCHVSPGGRPRIPSDPASPAAPAPSVPTTPATSAAPPGDAPPGGPP